ncbi:unnamed protein product [Symbiodinium natans]|uniref:Uncharacterized protein n=1 Tax=Symbiodinium natans TaxID=878477 RepID=A0A812QMG4_9DINO|nr:unnamed protein product [Symbiodinium natans]
MGSSFAWLLSLCSLLLAAADSPAEPTLPAMVARIIAGDFENNFFTGDFLKARPANEKEEVGACLLDKVGAIVTENGVEQFLNELQVDAAACCTKDRQDCVKDITKPYALLTSIRQNHADAKTTAPKVAAMLLRAVESRLGSDKVNPSHSHFFGKCKDIENCTMPALGASTMDL